jgi:hypothetical protein
MASGKRQPKKDAWLTLSPCAQPGFNPLPISAAPRGLAPLGDFRGFGAYCDNVR